MKNKKTPMRKCIGCQQSTEKKELLRLVRTPEGELLFDPSGKANGRGAYLCRKRECFEQARKRKAFNRAFELSLSDAELDRLSEEFAAYERKDI